MASNKNHQAKPVRSSSYLPKAGPKALGSKPKLKSFANKDSDTLFDGIKHDRNGNRDRTKKRANMVKHFDANMVSVALTKVVASNNAIRTVAEQIIINFGTAKADRTSPDPAEHISRTKVAINMLTDTLASSLLHNKNAMSAGKHAAYQALNEAHELLQAEIKRLDAPKVYQTQTA